jgi:hypothetical protein
MARGNFLKRAKATRDPKRRFIIYCEGENTEPGYFEALRRSFGRNALIELDVVPTGDPKTIAERAVIRAKALRRSRDSFERDDPVWAVFDRDEWPQSIYFNAIKICESQGVWIGRSNPCFEVWLILHEQDYDSLDDRHGVCKHLSTLHPEYDHKGAKTCDCNEMITRVEEAEERATKLLKRRENEGSPHGRPSTTVGDLTKAIRAAAEAAKRT